MEVGLVGLPYSGKTTLFSALTGMTPDPAAGAVRPNLGVANIPDPRLTMLADRIKTQKLVPAQLQLVDIAGLAPGGQGAGSRFLNHIQQVDALIHVVRCFTKMAGGGSESDLRPARDIDQVETELVLADLSTVENALPKAERAAKGKDKQAEARLRVLQRLAPVLGEGRPARTVSFDQPDELLVLKGMGLLSGKRVLYVANVDEDDPKGEGPLAQQVAQHAQREGMEWVAVCAQLESELAQMDEAERGEMLQSLGLAEPALAVLARAAYKLLGLMSFYTAGPKEIRAWTIRTGESAPEAAGTIHSDIQRGFIRAEIYSVFDLVELGSEKAIKEKGRLRVEGKNYVMQDADVCHFLFNV